MSADPPVLDDLLRALAEREASDLHLKPMRPPLLRVDGKLEPLGDEPLRPEAIDRMLDAILPEHLRERLDRDMAADFGYGLPGVSRFRASLFRQRGTRAAVFRRVPFDFPSLEDWGLPAVLGELTRLPQGLVLITGPTGSGKSSTLAAVLKRIATTRRHHIVTIEDPIEFLIADEECSVSQREIGVDTPDFATALRGILRQDPDVIMVGEMRDDETIRTTLTASETGHLVLSTLHTNSAYQTIDRILSGFPESNHRQVRQQLAACLEAVVSMQLVPRADGEGMVAAVEILRRSPQTAKLILQGDLEGLHEEIEASVPYYHMQSMNQSLAALLINGAITRETAMAATADPSGLDLLLRKTVGATGGQEQGDAMAEPQGDFSRILELLEVRRLYDELKDRHREETASRDCEITELREQLNELAGRGRQEEARVAELTDENAALVEQIRQTREEHESNLKRLDARIRELTAKAAEPSDSAGRKGLFRR